MEKCENLCGSEKTETTNDVDDDAPSVSLNYDQMLDLNHENSSYLNSSISDCNVSVYDDFDYNDKTVQEIDSKDNDTTIQNKFLTNDQHANSLNSLTELRENFVSIDSEYEKTCRAGHSGEKFVDSGISLTMEDDNKIMRQANDNSQNIFEKSNVVAVEENITNKRLTQNVTYINIEDSLQEELDIKNISVSTESIESDSIESNNCFINDNESYFKDDLNLPKHMEEKAKHTLSIEEDSIEKMITEMRKMNKIIKNLCASDEHHDSAEERMIEGVSAKMENDHDDVMRKIIESCSYVSADFQQHSPIREIPNTDFIRSNSECVIKKFQGNELFPRRVVSETAIAKEDILRTIEEAEKILIDSPCWDTSETNVNQTTKNYDKNNSLEKTMEKVKDDKEQERVSETVNEKEIDFIDNEDTKINSANMVIEKIAISECDSDIVESNFKKLAEITCSDRPRSRIEILETLEKIAEEKKKIEDRKKESLETLSKKLEEIDELVANHDFAFYLSDNDSCELKTPEDDSDSLDEFQIQIDPENFEVPLTKSKITENLKIEELEKELADEMEEHKKLMDEYQKIITTDLEKIQLTLGSESTQACDNADIDEEMKNASKDEKVNEKFSNETSEVMNTTDTTAIKIDSEFDEFFTEEKEPEKIYIKGKVYDFDEKRDGIR